MDNLIVIFAVILIGVSATALLDICSLMLKRVFKVASLNFCLVGRWRAICVKASSNTRALRQHHRGAWNAASDGQPITSLVLPLPLASSPWQALTGYFIPHCCLRCCLA